MIEKTIMATVLILANAFLTAQECDLSWNFVKEQEAIKVYTRLPADSEIKELKIEMEVESSLAAIVALIDDMDRYPEWVYNSTGIQLVERISDTELIYFNEIDFPWPLSDREVMVHSSYTQNEESKVITYTSKLCNDDRISVKKGNIRLKDYSSHWILTPLENGKVAIEYQMSSNPEGYLPAWLVNLVIDTGIIDTMCKFRNLLKEEDYVNSKLDYVSER